MHSLYEITSRPPNPFVPVPSGCATTQRLTQFTFDFPGRFSSISRQFRATRAEFSRRSLIFLPINTSRLDVTPRFPAVPMFSSVSSPVSGVCLFRMYASLSHTCSRFLWPSIYEIFRTFSIKFVYLFAAVSDCL